MAIRYYFGALVASLCTAQSFALEQNLETEIPLLIDAAYNSDTPALVITNKVVQLASSAANNKLDEVEKEAVESTDLTHLEITLGTDSLGLDSGTDTMLEGVGVYRLYESDELFLFNQSSFVLFDDRNTINTGFGVRNINEDETLILGANIFYDYESSSGHARHGYGVEALTSVLEFRANKYKANSGVIVYKGINESALDGLDYSVTAQLPYFHSSNIYAKQSKWEDGLGYETKHTEWGLNAEVMPDLTVRLASQQQDSNDAKFVASITYTKKLGADFVSVGETTAARLDPELSSVREKLYKPVQRENRIQKKSIKLGVTVSGY